MNKSEHVSQLVKKGYAMVSDVYAKVELDQMSTLIAELELEHSSVLESKDLFAIRQVLTEIPELTGVLFNEKLRNLLKAFDTDATYFLSKVLYFDKPKGSNWFVAYHQDLTINVSERAEVAGFKNWTNKRGQIGVQPPTEYLNRTITVRVHPDDTDTANGALRVVPKSHIAGVVRIEDRAFNARAVTCEIKSGGVMFMKPLIFHASSTSWGENNRRVIHLEFCDMELPDPLQWKERKEIWI